MHSRLPKVLHCIAGKPLLQHVYELAKSIPGNEIIIVYGHGGETVPSQLSGFDARWKEQKEQLGTGHAVMQTTPLLNDNDTALILYGDVPLLTNSTVDRLLACVNNDSIGLLTVELDDPLGYGRIIRDQAGKVLAIVEDKDALESQKTIKEVNTGIIALKVARLKAWLTQLENNNANKEYYLTDIIGMAVFDGIHIETIQPEQVDEVLGVNNKSQLAHLERVYQNRQAQALMQQGVTLLDPLRFDARTTSIEVGHDVIIDINVVLEGELRIGNRVKIGPNTQVKNCSLSDDVEILANCVIENAIIGKGCRVGPFARIRPEAELCENVHVGNFVEIKKSQVASGTKINHLSYIGDSIIGSNVNIGAGTITCNYDGANKFQTIIEDGAFIGSDTQLVAPVKVGKNSTVGAGSTITRDTPADTLTLSRSKQLSLPGWQRPIKKRS